MTRTQRLGLIILVTTSPMLAAHLYDKVASWPALALIVLLLVGVTLLFVEDAP